MIKPGNLNFLIFTFALLISISSVNAFSKIPSVENNGSITGKVIDEETQNIIPNAVVKIIDTEYKTTTDTKGNFSFENIKYGTYRLEASAVGYKPKVKTDIVVYSQNPVETVFELVSSGITTELIEVEGNYFQKSSYINTSAVSYDYEEIRRAPGVSEDISRMLQTAPGISLVNDSRNDLIVRGGSPAENLFMIDGVEIPNINHYGTMGSTGGPIGFINLKFIREANIFTGGFNSKYGDKMSGIVDIKFREGSYTNRIFNFDFNMAGFAGIFEGPVAKNFSYLISVRRSYLDLLKDAIKLSAVPNYWDFNLKLSYKLNDNNTLSLIGFSALDKINLEYNDETSVNDWPYDSDNKTNTYTLGLNYTRIFRNGYWQTVVSNTYTKYFSDNIFKLTGVREYYWDTKENETTYKTDLVYRICKAFTFSLTAGGKYAIFDNHLYLISETTPEGYVLPEVNVNGKIEANKYFAGVNTTTKVLNDKLIINAGVRYDYFNYINLKNTFSPRIGLSYNFLKNTFLNLSYGMYYQTPQYIWLSTNERNKNLSSMKSIHYIVGIEHQLSRELNFLFEVYNKDYSGYPVSIANPEYILIDGGMDYGPNFINEAGSVGHGYVRGLDIMFQKKLTGNGFYGQMNYSYSKSGFFAIAGGEKPAAFDPTHQFTIIAGYQVADDWLVGLKFRYAGGRPYTPFNISASTTLGRGVYDMSKFNNERYPVYHRLDLRVDKKFYFKKVTITTYIELQNVYNRENIFGYFWNKAKNEKGTVLMWSFMPIGGVNIEF